MHDGTNSLTPAAFAARATASCAINPGSKSVFHILLRQPRVVANKTKHDVDANQSRLELPLRLLTGVVDVRYKVGYSATTVCAFSTLIGHIKTRIRTLSAPGCPAMAWSTERPSVPVTLRMAIVT